MKQPTDNFMTHGPPLEVKLLHSLGYRVLDVDGKLFMRGRRITTWVADVPVCCTIIRTEAPKLRRVEYFCPVTREWVTVARGQADSMRHDDILDAIQTRVNDAYKRAGIAKSTLPDQARMDAIGFENGIASIFTLLTEEKLKALSEGKPAVIRYRGETPFPADVYILPPVKA